MIIGTGCGVNDDSIGTCSSPKKYKHSNGGVIYGTNANERILGADKRVLVGRKIPGVSLGYDETLEIRVMAGGKINWQSIDKDVNDGSKVQLTLAVLRQGCLRQKKAQQSHAGSWSMRMPTTRAKSS